MHTGSIGEFKVEGDKYCDHHHDHNRHPENKVAVRGEAQVTLDGRNLPKQGEDNGSHDQKSNQSLQGEGRSIRMKEGEEAMKHLILAVQGCPF